MALKALKARAKAANDRARLSLSTNPSVATSALAADPSITSQAFSGHLAFEHLEKFTTSVTLANGEILSHTLGVPAIMKTAKKFRQRFQEVDAAEGKDCRGEAS